jgi:UDP-N-acetylmuramate dehydrogenase
VSGFVQLARRLREEGIDVGAEADVRPYLTFRIGGPVRLLAVADTLAQLRSCVFGAAAAGVPHVMLGGGSNTVFGDSLTRALVIVNRAGRIRAVGPGRVRVESGARNTALLSWCVAHAAAGLECLAGIPGSVGGTVAVNAGSMGRHIGERVRGALIIDETGRERRVDAAYFDFAYRSSRLKFGLQTILTVTLAVEPGDGRELSRLIAEAIAYRQQRHPGGQEFSAGCFFKNPEIGGRKVSAGQLIEASGLKGMRLGDVAVSERHANFLLNRGSARFADLMAVEAEVCRAVSEKQGVRLEREVVCVDAEGNKF